MKQLLQDAGTGNLSVSDVPAPQLLPGCVLVRTAASLVSAGTERAAAEFARKNLIAKAQARPDLVRDVLSKLQRDGLAATLGAVRSRLGQPQSVGYSSAGTIIAVGDGVTDLRAGDRVACAGAGYAVHAEIACVPRLLVARIPDAGEGRAAVSLDEAAFGTVGAICLHGVRTARAALGDVVAVIGLGLLGQITVQLLRAAGCRVLGVDPLRDRAERALRTGAEATCGSAEEFRDRCYQITAGIGVDAVLIAAETPSSDPVNLAAEIARDRATVVAVGTVGMELERKLYYEKELEFHVSRSYGPGRYDVAYEQKGRDYPIGHVRWTETRNLEAILRLVSERKLDVASLITQRFPMEQAARAYEVILGRTTESSLGVLLIYPEAARAESQIRQGALAPQVAPSAQFRQAPQASPRKSEVAELHRSNRSGEIGLGVLGAGSFAQSTLLPALKKIREVSFISVCNATGARSRAAADKFGFPYCWTDDTEILNDPEIDAVVIATRHNLHARQTLAALAADKAVFCEKPLCLSESDLAEIVQAVGTQPRNSPLLMVGFNRRFAPLALELKTFLAEIREPISLHYRVNAGFLPPDHWVNDPEIGGGRILGEVCHFVDMLCFLAGSCPAEVQAQCVANPGHYSVDNIVAQLKFPNGGLGIITYMANGDKAASKERLEVFGGSSVGVLEDFRYLELVRHGRRRISRSRFSQDKGHLAEMRAFVAALRGETPAPVPFEEIVASTLATLRLKNAFQAGMPLTVDAGEFIATALRQKLTA
jgi:predicted dehydrogenase/threonine dehydrogenase-like Zn-dependent dehydrogenase